MTKKTTSRAVPTQRAERVTGTKSVHDNVFQDEPTPGALDVRASREQESREAEDIHPEYPDSWQPKGVLDTTNIPPRPGFVQMWVRTKIGSEDDVANIGRKMNEGWRPRLKDTVPKGAYVPVCQMSDYGEVIGIRGMILMSGLRGCTNPRWSTSANSPTTCSARQTRTSLPSMSADPASVALRSNGIRGPS